jgi:hypothetical protein
MKIEEVKKMLPKNDWLSFFRKNTDFKKRISLSNNDEKEILELIGLELEKNRIGRATDFIYLGILNNKDRFLNKLRKKGILRHTSYVNNRNPLPSLSKRLIENKKLFALNENDEDYFRSLNNMDIFHKEYSKLYRDTIEQIVKLRNSNKKKRSKKELPKSIIKTLIVYNELNFLKEYYRTEDHDIGKLEYYTKEHISEAISFIISIWEDKFELDEWDLTLVDYKFLKSKEIESLIANGCLLKLFQEIEIDIECVGYKVNKVDDVLFIEPQTEDFGKSTDLSFIVHEFQSYSDYENLKKELSEYYSYEDLIDRTKKSFDEFVELKHSPYKRYVFKIPDIFLKKFCAPELQLFFREELFIIERIQKELLIPYHEFKQFKIKGNLTLAQFINLFKSFIFINAISSYYLIKKMEEDEVTVINSICPIFKEDAIYYLLGNIEKEDVVTDFLDILTWEAGIDKYLDLQYKPIIYIDGYYCLSPSIITKSNTIRNIFPSESKSGNLLMKEKNKNYDKLVDKINKTLKSIGFQVWTEIPVKFSLKGKEQSDIDILAIKNNFLLVIECKDTINPTDSFEYRTTHNHIIKAKDQILYHLKAIENSSVKSSLKNNFKIDLSEVNKICPLILLSTRRPWGFELEKIAIRNIHEFIAFLTKGKWYYNFGNEKPIELNVWEGEKLKINDIENFLSTNFKPHNFILKAMIAKYLNFNDKILIKKYALGMEKLAESLK